MPNNLITYSGIEGLLKITKNSLKAEGELLIFETSYASLNDMFSKGNAELIRSEFIRKRIKIRELTNKIYHENYTDIKEFHEKVMQIRYIDPKKLNIKIETLIYNDVVAIYDLKNIDLCIEVYNRDLANQQRQLFEYIWQKGERPIIGRGGRTSIF